MLSSAYLIPVCFLLKNIEKIVIEPKRPINMVILINIFDIKVKLKVIPVDSPTVPYADTASKSSDIKLSFF